MAESSVQDPQADVPGADGSGAAPTNGGGPVIEVENPATGEIAGTVPQMSPADVAPMVERARAAQPFWRELGFEGRARVMRRAQKWLIDNADRVVDTIVSETGKTRMDANTAEIGYGAAALGFWSKNAEKFLHDERVRSSSPFALGKKLVVRYHPLGVVGVIGPWNYPLANSFGDAIPALMAGNSVVLKPSEVTPLTSIVLGEMLAECGAPENVFQVLTGLGDVGAELVDHVDFVMFTGSTATGRKVAERAAKTLTPVGLELGGKDPMIVLRDADLEKASNAATYYSMQNGGQTCISIERVYVEEPIYDEFVKLVTEKVGALRQGIPGDYGSVDVGAVTFEKQADILDCACRGRPRQGGLDPCRRTSQGRSRPVLRADGAARRGPFDGVHDRGVVRPDAADHEGGRRRRGGQARQRLAVRAPGLGLDARHRTWRGDRHPPRGGRRERQRAPAELPDAGVADGRLEGLRPRHAPRLRRDQEVLP